VPTLKLNSGYEVPVLGLGTYNDTSEVMVQTVQDAIAAGYRHIDTAELYGNEADIGKGLAIAIKAGHVKREEVFITSKIKPTGRDRKTALEAVQTALKNLDTPYVDLMLIHWPEGNVSDIYAGLEDAVSQKLVHSIGVSNFEVKNLNDLLKTAKVKPAMNQIEIHPNKNQDETVDLCKKEGIVVTGFSPLGTGTLLKESHLVAIGTAHKKSSAQVCLRWQIQRGLVTIPKTTHKDRLTENIDVFGFELSETEMKTIHDIKA
jgi:diketogulonate reductase-like aldo/keto reductase